MVTVEACVASVEEADMAQLAGADRIELNSALELDGLTPSVGLVKIVSHRIRIPIIAMARPRPGNFCYTEAEWETLLEDAKWLLNHGATGIAFGCLKEDGQVNRLRCQEMRALAGSRPIVFHKAFDDTPDWESALGELIDCGINRVMTSGQKPTASEGAATIAQMAQRAGSEIEILPAGRVSSLNAVQIVNQTGVTQVHGSFSSGPELSIGPEIERTIGQLRGG